MMSLMLKYVRVGLRIVSVSIQGSIPTHSTICPRYDEYTRYTTKVRYLIVEDRDNNLIVEPLQFFAEYKSQFPILAGIAAIVHAQVITTGDMERINSRRNLL